MSKLALRLIEENKKTRNPVLDLGNCGLTHVPDAIGDCTWLETLILSNSWLEYDEKGKKWVEKESRNKGEENRLEALPKCLARLKGLKKLFIGPGLYRFIGGGLYRLIVDGYRWSLSDLSPLSQLNQLQTLYCSRTQVSDLSPLSQLNQLHELVCSGTQVSDLSPLSQLNQLQRLNCSGTQVSDLSPLSQLNQLHELVCSDTQVSDLSPLSQLNQLQRLDCSFTQVSDLSPLSQLNQLQTLHCHDTQVSDLSPLSQLNQLQTLDCSRTKVSDLSPLSQLNQLQTLYCFRTQVSDLSPLSQLNQLQTLHCSFTQVSDLSPLSQLNQLQTLYCSFTQVSDLSPLSQLNQLDMLDCSYTQVKKIRPLIEMKALRSFSVDGCPIEDCPADIYQQRNIKLLRRYFSQISDAKPQPKDTDTHRDVKLILLGNSDAGKTTLLHYLQTGEFLQDRDSTHGLKVHRWEPNTERFPALENIAVSVWDFGGQEYYHETYRLFMSDNAVYLLLWDAETNINGHRLTCLRTGESEVLLEHFELRYWLDTVQHYAGERNNAPLFVVQNKTDLEAGKRRLDQLLHDNYRIRESLHISLRHGCDPQHPRQQQALRLFEREIEAAIAEAADKAPLPLNWLTVRQHILDLQKGNSEQNDLFNLRKDGSVSLEEFEKAAAKIMDKENTGLQKEDLPRTFHRGGVVVFFEQSETLRNRVFLKPAELTRRIYDILNQQVLEKKGEFRRDDLGGDDDSNQVFLEVAKQLELIFPHPLREGWYIAPQYLPDEHPVEDLLRIAARGVWHAGFWLRMPLFHYKRLMHRLILHYAQKEHSEARHFWKHGIVFLTKGLRGGLRDGLRVLLKGLYPAENEHDGVLLIGVEGAAEGKREALDWQKEIFEQCLRFLAGHTGDEGKEAASRSSDSEEGRLDGFPKKDKKIWELLDVSNDGEYFVQYAQLYEFAERGHIRMPGKNKEGQEQTLLIRHFEALLPRPPRRAKRVFLSYSHRNTEWLVRLRVHLSGLRRSNDVEVWTDQEILPGDRWDEVIQKNLAETDVFILLLSADAVASDYIWDKELKPAIEDFLQKKKQFIPILIEPTDYGALPGVVASSHGEAKVQNFEIIPKDTNGHLKAVSLWDNPEEALAKVAEQIRKVIKGEVSSNP